MSAIGVPQSQGQLTRFPPPAILVLFTFSLCGLLLHTILAYVTSFLLSLGICSSSITLLCLCLQLYQAFSVLVYQSHRQKSSPILPLYLGFALGVCTQASCRFWYPSPHLLLLPKLLSMDTSPLQPVFVIATLLISSAASMHS